MVKKTITSLLKESEDDIEIADDWYEPDEFDSDEIEGPTDADIDMGDDFIDGDEIDDVGAGQDKKEKVADLMRSILAKQGYSGERLEREVEKRMKKDKPDMATRRADSWFDNADGEYNVGGIYDDGLYECVSKAVKKALNEIGDTDRGQDCIGQAAGRRDAYAENEYLKNGCSKKYKKDSALRDEYDKKSKSEIAKSNSKHKSDLRHSYNQGFFKGRGKGLSESKLNRIVKESVNKILNELS